MEMFDLLMLSVYPRLDSSHTHFPNIAPNCTNSWKNEFQTVDWDKFKNWQLYWAPSIEVYMIIIPRNVFVIWHQKLDIWDYEYRPSEVYMGKILW